MARNLRSTASDEIYQILKKEILSLNFEPGMELKINSLCEQLKVSRSPIRDALMKLASDGLVEIFPQRGTRVSLINLHLVAEERFLRSSLEEKAMVNLFPILTDENIEELGNLIKYQESIKNTPKGYDFFNADLAFHKLVFKLINKNECWNIISKQCVNYDRVRLLSFKEKENKEIIIEQHIHILEALKSKKKSLIEKVVTQHLGKIDDDLKIIMDKYPTYFDTSEKLIQLSK